MRLMIGAANIVVGLCLLIWMQQHWGLIAREGYIHLVLFVPSISLALLNAAYILMRTR